MGKFTNLETDVFSIFASPAWNSEDIQMVPVDVEPEGSPKSYCRFSIIPSDNGIPGFAKNDSVSGVIMIEIFSPAGEGPSPFTDIADKLDAHLQTKYVGKTQTFVSTLGAAIRDRDNPALARAIYQIPFSHFGA